MWCALLLLPEGPGGSAMRSKSSSRWAADALRCLLRLAGPHPCAGLAAAHLPQRCWPSALRHCNANVGSTCASHACKPFTFADGPSWPIPSSDTGSPPLTAPDCPCAPVCPCVPLCAPDCPSLCAPARLLLLSLCIMQLVAEVEERRAFLMDMRRLGQGSQHAAAITAEISQRLRQLEALGVA